MEVLHEQPERDQHDAVHDQRSPEPSIGHKQQVDDPPERACYQYRYRKDGIDEDAIPEEGEMQDGKEHYGQQIGPGRYSKASSECRVVDGSASNAHCGVWVIGISIHDYDFAGCNLFKRLEHLRHEWLQVTSNTLVKQHFHNLSIVLLAIPPGQPVPAHG
jgi:hypothetical protein